MRRVVVLPQPDGPSSVKNSPGGMCRSMPSTATTSPKAFVSSSSSTLALHVSTSEGRDGGRVAAAGEPPVDEERERERRAA